MYNGSGAIGYVLGKIEGMLLQVSPFISEITTARSGKATLNERINDVAGTVPTGLATQFDADLVYQATGNATVWDDLKVPISAIKAAGSKIPGWEIWIGNLYLYWFDASSEEEVWFAIQMPHGWAGTQINPHVHWVPKITSDGVPTNQIAEWGLEYSWVNIGGDFPATTTIYGSTTIPNDAVIVANRHYMTTLTPITPSVTQNGLSSMLMCRLFRNATGTNDTYESDAGLLEFDIHYEIDMLGSRSVSSK